MSTKQSPIKSLPRGEFVQLKEGGPVWVRGDYDRGSKSYELQSWDDANKFIYRKGSALVYHGFTF